MTLRETLNAAVERLRTRADIAEWAVRDANLLLQHVTGLSRAQVLADPDRKISSRQASAFEKLIAQRLDAVPVQHLTGSQEFYGRSFRVTPDVLIPRPETELIVEEALAFAGAPAHRDAVLRITDVGTGSGVLAVTLACELPAAAFTATDISPKALAVAHANAAVHRVMQRVRFLECDLLAGVQELQDVIVSNPPYIGRDEAAEMHAQVLEHEPHLALFAERGGDALYERLVPEAWTKLKPGGALIVELGTQGRRLDPLFADWAELRYVKDLQGIDRVIVATRPSV